MGDIDYARIIILGTIAVLFSGSPSKKNSKFWAEYQEVTGEENKLKILKRLMVVIEALIIGFVGTIDIFENRIYDFAVFILPILILPIIFKYSALKHGYIEEVPMVEIE